MVGLLLLVGLGVLDGPEERGHSRRDRLGRLGDGGSASASASARDAPFGARVALAERAYDIAEQRQQLRRRLFAVGGRRLGGSILELCFLVGGAPGAVLLPADPIATPSTCTRAPDPTRRRRRRSRVATTTALSHLKLTTSMSETLYGGSLSFSTMK